MRYNPDIHRRRSIRLKDYDYSQAGMYFITICTQNHEYLFGEIIEEKMLLNEAGKMIEKWYVELTNKFPDIEGDEYIIMPNHVHFIIHKIDQNKPDKQKMNNPRRGGPMCPPICSPIDILPITNRADTQVCPYDDKNEKLNDEKNSMDMNRRGEPMCSPNPRPPIMHLSQTNKINTAIIDENIMKIKKIGENGIKNVSIKNNIEKSIIRADTQVCPYDDKNEKLNDEKNSMDINCWGVNMGRHAGLPLRKIEKNDERITENKETDESTMGSSIPKIVQWFKTMTTNEYIRRVKQDGWKPFNGRLWQRNYYEHIIRNENELNQIREYIINNPLKWKFDKEYFSN